MSKLRLSLVSLAVAATFTACGGDSDPLGVNSGDPLSEDEIQSVFFAIAEAFTQLDFGPAATGPARATISVNENFSGSANCPVTGSVSGNGSAAGTVDDETFELDLRYQLRLDMTNCGVQSTTNTITLNGAPFIQLDMDFVLTETLIDVSGTQTGGIAFTSTDGRSGSCAFDVAFSSTANLNTQQGNSSTTGTVCGVSVSGLQVWAVD